MRESKKRKPCVVVGYDGSEPARAAVEYAAARVGEGGRLLIVHSSDPAVLDELLLEAGETLLDTDFELRVSGGAPADGLVEIARAEDADEIVLGSRGLGRVTSLLGSVSQDVLHRADRPVVIIPYGAVRDQPTA